MGEIIPEGFVTVNGDLCWCNSKNEVTPIGIYIPELEKIIEDKDKLICDLINKLNEERAKYNAKD